jgi:hypothetical protein
MSAPHHSLLTIPPLAAYGQSNQEGSVDGDIDAYLRGDDLVDYPAASASTSFAPDDISLMRAAHQLAGEIRVLESSEVPITASAKRTHRVSGGALSFVIQRCSSRVRLLLGSDFETVGQFRSLIAQFVQRRITKLGQSPLYDEMQGDYWTNELQLGLMQCVEQLWDVSIVTGLINQETDPHAIYPLLNTMATVYTISWFGAVEVQHIDILTIDFAVSKLSCYTLNLLSKHD